MNKKQKILFLRIILGAVIYVPLIIISKKTALPESALCVMFLVPYFIAGYDVFLRALKSVKNKQLFDENQLMLIASVGAFATREFSEAVAVILFYQIGELFQSVAVERSRRSVSELMDICPEYANIETDGKIEKVDPDEVSVGDVIVIMPGEKIPLDCKVISGSSSVNTAALTGESVPVGVNVGSELLSGSINGEGVIYARVEKEFEDSAVTKILELVESASEKKSPTENFITRFAKYYTPAVVCAAFLLALVPPVFVGNIGEWVKRACTFLVISCPCALVISIPMGFFGGIGGASKNGILVKGGVVLENLSRLRLAAFDKTGTLTKGNFVVTEAVPAEGLSKSELLSLAAAAEHASTHPIARSIKEAAGEADVVCENITEVAGRGVCADISGKKLFVGNKKLLNENGICVPSFPDEAATLVFVAVGKKYCGCIFINDEVKVTSKEALEELKNAGVKKTVMLTGDKRTTAESVGKNVGIDEIFSELLPEGKAKTLEDIKNSLPKNEKLAFVGDGINDAPVLILADVGVAMGAIGSDAAIEAADVVIVDDNLKKLPLAVKIAKKTMRIVKSNIIFALGVKLLVLVLGALGIASMWLAVFADVGVAVIAILNAMRALKV